MTIEPNVSHDALDDSRATLRQADAVLTDLDGTTSEHPSTNGAPTGEMIRPGSVFREFIRTLVQTYAEMAGVIESLRSSRGLLEQAASTRLKQKHESLIEVSSATETAATGILDGLDRSLELVDCLDPGASSDGEVPGSQADSAALLRDELHKIMGIVQFQDITAQQLGHAAGVLQDIEQRLVALSDFFDLRDLGLEELVAAGVSIGEPEIEEDDELIASKCDPAATTLNAEERQNVADEVFTGR